jgi:triosephosphate isomerase
MVAPTSVNLFPSVSAADGTSIEVIAQNMHEADNGAFTGEISGSMLKSIGVNSVILGHSERRAIYGETDELLAQKVDAALNNHIRIIFCVGETLEVRKQDQHFIEVANQIRKSLFHLSAADWKNIVIAYEPVWAIGTGETASPDQAQEMHDFIRKIINKKYTSEISDNVSILYGGSVKPNNAKEIFAKEDVDGGLIGGASLKAEDFLAIINSI